ncbi:MAG: hypothetical protein CO170_03940 [candidate division SR1 bacterium CG_4_9_14_3_um_filter_40_9]|nr:MAG: hypothetical protein CO170_03940 [candidate division SR1 bacterium CG_4_9_14_3_um_filter_40_9]
MKYFIIIFLSVIFYLSYAQAYFFGLKSADNTIANIQQIQEKYNLNIPVVSFIFDPRGQEVRDVMNALSGTLGTDKVYHITIAPESLTAKEVADGRFDKKYRIFFQLIKTNKLKVIFRTMHEMNGGRYPRSSNPETFKKARVHVRKLSREEGLTAGNILFDFSVNHRDMPTKDPRPSQNSKLIQCKRKNKEALQCPTFEDYYPGDEYVDIMGFTFYNRGKASYNRDRLTPAQIVNQKGRNTLKRIKAFNKPIFIDEVATTAVRYEDKYNAKKSREAYKTDSAKKNKRIRQLQHLMDTEYNILGFVYFNVDYTKGLTQRPIGEADRSAIDLTTKKIYPAILDVAHGTQQIVKRNQLMKLFGVWPDISRRGKNLFLNTGAK